MATSNSTPAEITELRKQIDEANILQAVDLCKTYRLFCEKAQTLDALKKILYDFLETKGTKNDDLEIDRDKNFQKLILNITEEYAEMKEFIYGIYLSINELIKMRNFDECLKEEISSGFANYQDTIKSNQQELENKDCPIIVTGETSAGKSSLINLLLKTEILPTSLLRCTSVICRLRNSGKKMVAIYDKDDVEVETFPVENVNELRQRIKECTCLSDDVSYNQLKYKYVDIHWPIQFLPENVTLVDTPGIADSADMTATVFEYLQHAIAYIYVVNSANAGGVQKDRVINLMTNIFTVYCMNIFCYFAFQLFKKKNILVRQNLQYHIHGNSKHNHNDYTIQLFES